MYRTSLAVFLSGTLLIWPCLAQVATQPQQSQSQNFDMRGATDTKLIASAGLNGRYESAEDAALMNKIRDELARRANEHRNAAAAYAYARELEFPTIASFTPDLQNATKWYVYAQKLGSLGGAYHVGYMYYSGRGLPLDEKYGRQLMNWAVSKGFNQQLDAIPPRNGISPEQRNAELRAAANARSSSSDTSNVVIGAAVLLGLAALLSSGSSNDTTSDQPQMKGYEPLKSCYGIIGKRWVPSHTVNGSGHYEDEWGLKYAPYCP